MSDTGRPTPGDAGRVNSAGNPADDFGELWEALDSLPRAAASTDMAATTVDMAAIAAGRTSRRDPFGRSGSGAPDRRWFLPAAAVVGSLVVGLIAGRLTAPDPDIRILESLPVVRHLGLLEEAGSVAFLRSLAARRNQQPLRLPPDARREEEQEFDAALQELEVDHLVGTPARPLLAQRREALAALAGEERDSLERSVVAFQELTTAQRRDLAALAAVLADPKREELRNAARTWHLVIAASNPPDRKNIIELDAEGRIEWLERPARLREWMGERRGPPLGPDGLPLPRGPGGAGAPGDGRPRWQGPRGEGAPQVPRSDGGPQGGRGEGRGRGDGPPSGDGTARGNRGTLPPDDRRPEPPAPPRRPESAAGRDGE